MVDSYPNIIPVRSFRLKPVWLHRWQKHHLSETISHIIKFDINLMKAKITNIENTQVLRMNPFGTFRSDYEIVNGIFGGRDKYQEAIQELENKLYKNRGNR